MDPKHDGSRVLLAPPADGGARSYSFPSDERRGSPAFPPIDEHLVRPEVTRDEMIRGRKVIAMPSEKEHAEAQVRMDFVFAVHVKPGYIPAADLITRVSEGSDFATDLSIRKEGLDPATGKRYLEELSFEIVNEQSMRDVREKAEDLIARGVRRVFAIFVKKGIISEWSRERNNFVPMDSNAMFDDPLLIRPIAVQALIDATLAEAEVVRALWKKGNPEIKRIEDEGRKRGFDEGHKKGLDEGHKKGLDEARRLVLLDLLRTRFGEVSAAMEARVQMATSARIDSWMKKILTAGSIEEALD